MDEKKVKEGCYALAFALFFSPIEKNPIYHTAQDIFTQIEAHINPTQKKRGDALTVDHLKRGISKLKAAVKHLAKCGYIEVSSFYCQLPGTLNDEVKDRGKQIKVLRRPPVHVLVGVYDASSPPRKQDIDNAIESMAIALFECCQKKEAKKSSSASGQRQQRDESGRFDEAPISVHAVTPAPHTRNSSKRNRDDEEDEADYSISSSAATAVAVSPQDVIPKRSDSETSVKYEAVYSELDKEAHNFRAWEMQQKEDSEEAFSMTRASLFEQRMPLTYGAKIASISSSSYARKNARADATLATAQANFNMKMKEYNAASLEFQEPHGKRCSFPRKHRQVY